MGDNGMILHGVILHGVILIGMILASVWHRMILIGMMIRMSTTWDDATGMILNGVMIGMIRLG
jgi:hypothetical protein